MADFMNPMLCANVTDGAQCQLAASVACTGCFLVQYCFKKCQRYHQAIHRKKVCHSDMMKANWKPNWTVEKRIPKFADGTENPTLQFGPHVSQLSFSSTYEESY
jgi:hypothetical protein